VQRTILWEDDVATTHADFDEAKDAFSTILDKAARNCGDDGAKVVLCFSCPTRRYFRHDLLPTYKGNRKSTPPLLLRELKQWASEEWETKTKPHLEADDVLGILATHPKLIKGPKIVVSADKDLQQIPGLHMSLDGLSSVGVFRVEPRFAERFMWRQVLTGDTSDNYTGCPGIGPVKADKLLSGVSGEAQLAAVVWSAYEKAGLTTDDLATQVNVARILTADTYDFKRKEPILWQM
jgi:DNA polymerase-1